MTKVEGHFDKPFDYKNDNEVKAESNLNGRKFLTPSEHMSVYDCIKNIQYKYTFDELDCTDLVYDIIN